MKKLLLASVLTLALPAVAYGTTSKTLPNTTIQQAKKEMKDAFCQDGRQGVIKLVSNCYLESNNKDKCMLEDSVLIVFDKQMDDMFKAQSGQGVNPDGFLSDTAVETRARIYFNPRFGSVKNAMKYFSKAGNDIINTMRECEKN
ncbi:unnamed protein product [Commensalibacter communis]|uniref:Uncharacterized protein n=1 Tax=Commensalibacter communis TaxID=2972786 RepID=A0A9W4XIW1_9PROT|nr:hypothetical protein [Commensalibacter communis]CAI3941655.1 unnamed protein product [Commensalibacter communis]CAI3944970.1 unnamed protein product [Commensalibacter communis]CAI3959158.1 unnamed protein product [Commensalibacter communis]CAI3960909.1 unnamed protein product [Commensalibacter communis]